MAHIWALALRRKQVKPAQMSLLENTHAAVAGVSRVPLGGAWLQVELRAGREGVHPPTEKAVRRPPTAILKHAGRPWRSWSASYGRESHRAPVREIARLVAG